MVEIKLSNADMKLLDEVLTRSLDQLHDEITHTNSTEYRDMLKKRKGALLKIQGRLH